MIRKRRFVAWLAAAVLAAAVMSAPASNATAQGSTDYAALVAEWDRLIAAQENLLNAYRCLFGVDLEVVSGKCPAPEVVPGPLPPNPSANELVARDQLVWAQESLLNTYRCAYEVDMEIVPGGCTDAGEDEVVAACGANTDGSVRGVDKENGVVTIGTSQPFTGRASVAGESLLGGIQMAVDEINAAGGIDGCTIRLV